MSLKKDWFQRLLPPKERKHKGAVLGIGKFRPYLHYNKERGIFYVFLRDCSRKEVAVSRMCNVFVGNCPKKRQEKLVGFSLFGVRSMLFLQGYKRSSIPLAQLLNRFKRFCLQTGAKTPFGEYEEKIFAAARKHQFVWHIPPLPNLRVSDKTLRFMEKVILNPYPKG